jgi:hypothetical protein
MDPNKWMINYPKSTSGVTSPNTTSLDPRLGRLGSLDIFPVETLQDIYRSLDLQSLENLRFVSSKSKAVVECLHEYQLIRRYVPEVLHALISTNCASSYFWFDLFFALCHDRCVICEDEYGPYIFLPTAERCCNRCLYMAQPLEIIPLTTVVEYISEEEIRESMVVATTLPGYYMGDYTFSQSIQIVRWEAAFGLCLEINSNAANLMFEEHERSRPQYELRYDHVPSLIGVDHPRESTSGMAAMQFPYLNVQTGRIESGTWCRGCEHDFLNVLSDPWRLGWPNPYRLRHIREKAFSKAEFLLHFEGCVRAKRLLGSREGGS